MATIMTAKNSFQEGLIMDFTPDNTGANCMTSALNATLLTFNGNEMSLQNDMGNGRVETAYLPEGYVPVGTCEFGDIIYVVSYNPLINKSQIGCFPSPERNISSEELFENNITLSTNDFLETDTDGSPTGYLKTTTVKKVLLENNLHSGDKYIISGSNLNNCYISDYGNTDHIKGKFPNFVKINVVAIEDSGKITYLDSNVKWYNNNYYIHENSNTTTDFSNDIDSYRNLVNSAYNTFSSKVSGKLALLIELEKINSFDCTWECYNENSDINENLNSNNYKIYWNFNWESFNYDVNPNKLVLLESKLNGSDYAIDQTEWNITRNYLPEQTLAKNQTLYSKYCDLLYSKTIEEYKNIQNINRYYNENAKIECGKYIATYINKSDNLNNPIEIYDSIVNNYFKYPVTKEFTTFSFDNNSNNIYKYKIAPAMPYGILEDLSIEGNIDFSKIGTTHIDLNMWKYYKYDDSISITYGLDAYVEPGKIIKLVKLEFYDNLGLAAVYIAPFKNSYNGVFTNLFKLNDFDTKLYNDSNKYYHTSQIINVKESYTKEEYDTLINGSYYINNGTHIKTGSDTYELVQNNEIPTHIEKNIEGNKTYEISKKEILKSDNFNYDENEKKYKLKVSDTNISKIYQYDFGTLYHNWLYLVKIIVTTASKTNQGVILNDEKSILLERWLWTNDMFNDKYYNTLDFKDLNFELTFDVAGQYKPITEKWKWDEYNIKSNIDVINDDNLLQGLSANVSEINLDNDINLNLKLDIGLNNTYNTFKLNKEGKLNEIKVLIFEGEHNLKNYPEQPNIIFANNNSIPILTSIYPTIDVDLSGLKYNGNNLLFTTDGYNYYKDSAKLSILPPKFNHSEILNCISNLDSNLYYRDAIDINNVFNIDENKIPFDNSFNYNFFDKNYMYLDISDLTNNDGKKIIEGGIKNIKPEDVIKDIKYICINNEKENGLLEVFEFDIDDDNKLLTKTSPGVFVFNYNKNQIISNTEYKSDGISNTKGNAKVLVRYSIINYKEEEKEIESELPANIKIGIKITSTPPSFKLAAIEIPGINGTPISKNTEPSESSAIIKKYTLECYYFDSSDLNKPRIHFKTITLYIHAEFINSEFISIQHYDNIKNITEINNLNEQEISSYSSPINTLNSINWYPIQNINTIETKNPYILVKQSFNVNINANFTDITNRYLEVSLKKLPENEELKNNEVLDANGLLSNINIIGYNKIAKLYNYLTYSISLKPGKYRIDYDTNVYYINPENLEIEYIDVQNKTFNVINEGNYILQSNVPYDNYILLSNTSEYESIISDVDLYYLNIDLNVINIKKSGYEYNVEYLLNNEIDLSLSTIKYNKYYRTTSGKKIKRNKTNLKSIIIDENDLTNYNLYLSGKTEGGDEELIPLFKYGLIIGFSNYGGVDSRLEAGIINLKDIYKRPGEKDNYKYGQVINFEIRNNNHIPIWGYLNSDNGDVNISYKRISPNWYNFLNGSGRYLDNKIFFPVILGMLQTSRENFDTNNQHDYERLNYFISGTLADKTSVRLLDFTMSDESWYVIYETDISGTRYVGGSLAILNDKNIFIENNWGDCSKYSKSETNPYTSATNINIPDFINTAANSLNNAHKVLTFLRHVFYTEDINETVEETLYYIKNYGYLEDNYSVYTRDVIIKIFTELKNNNDINDLILFNDIKYVDYINRIKIVSESNISSNNNINLTCKGIIKNIPFLLKLDYKQPYENTSSDDIISSDITNIESTLINIESCKIPNNLERGVLYGYDYYNNEIIPLNLLTEIQFYESETFRIGENGKLQINIPIDAEKSILNIKTMSSSNVFELYKDNISNKITIRYNGEYFKCNDDEYTIIMSADTGWFQESKLLGLSQFKKSLKFFS